MGLLADYALVGVNSRTRASAEKTAAAGCAVCDTLDDLIALKPAYIVETARVEGVRAVAEKILRAGIHLVVISIGAFADAAFYERARQAAVEGGAKIHIASGAIAGWSIVALLRNLASPVCFY